MIFIAGVFPAAIYMTAFSTEQSIAAAAADEAFAKIKLYDVNWIDPNFVLGQMVTVTDVTRINNLEFAYPSIGANPADKQYYWSALCRWINPATSDRSVQVTVFVCRKTGAGSRFWYRDVSGILNTGLPYPVPVNVGVLATLNPYEISIIVANPSNPVEKTFINDGYTVVENTAGQIYRVLERYSPLNDNVVRLDRKWLGSSPVWVIPPPASGGRYPCVAVYQKVIRFSL
jgi:hypothetical protein